MTPTEQPKPRHRGIYLLPNLFTLAALFAGFYAIIMAMRGQFGNAVIAIFIAMIMDSLDGRVARLTQTQTDFGAQLDSLSDMISFGMAPAILAYSYSLVNLGKLGWLSAFIFAVAVALRLAIFNSTAANTDKKYFRGLASPPGAAIIAAFIWTAYDNNLNGHFISYLTMALTLITGWLMVSKLKYRSFKDFNLRDRVPFVAILVVVLIFVLIAFDPPEMLLLFSLIYGLSAPAVWLWRKLRYWRLKSSKKD